MTRTPLRYRTTDSSLRFEANAQAAALDREVLIGVTMANGGWLPEVERPVSSINVVGRQTTTTMTKLASRHHNQASFSLLFFIDDYNLDRKSSSLYHIRDNEVTTFLFRITNYPKSD